MGPCEKVFSPGPGPTGDCTTRSRSPSLPAFVCGSAMRPSCEFILIVHLGAALRCSSVQRAMLATVPDCLRVAPVFTATKTDLCPGMAWMGPGAIKGRAGFFF